MISELQANAHSGRILAFTFDEASKLLLTAGIGFCWYEDMSGTGPVNSLECRLDPECLSCLGSEIKIQLLGAD